MSRAPHDRPVPLELPEDRGRDRRWLPWAVGLAAATGLAAAGAWWLTGFRHEDDGGGPRAAATRPSAGADAGGSGAPSPSAVVPRVEQPTRDPAVRADLVAAIRARRARRGAVAGTGAAAAGDGAGATEVGPDTAEDAPLPLTKEQIRAGVREVAPMLGDCYQQALLDRGLRLDATLVAHLVLESEPDLGTVVYVDDQQATHLDVPGVPDEPPVREATAELVRCVEVTLETVALPPLPAGGRLAVTYPFRFAPGPDDHAP